MRKSKIPHVFTTVFMLIMLLIVGCERPDDSHNVDATNAPPAAAGRLARLLGADGIGDFPLALSPREFQFPDDHGPHPEYRNEWWYVTGNLDAANGERVGFELTLFRFALATVEPMSESAWRTNQVYVGHFAITRPSQAQFFVAERSARGALGLAGSTRDPVRVWIGDWEFARLDGPAGERFRIVASDEGVSLALEFAPLKPAVLNGDDGLSRKSETPGNASYYYSMTRLAASGELVIDEERLPVNGLAWLDREWGSSALSADQAGWDWFALQLDDDSELMFYNLRRSDGTPDSTSAGTFVAPSGERRSLVASDAGLEVRRTWETADGVRYPISWRLRIPALALDLQIDPILDDQELNTQVRYWEGAVDVVGTRGGEPVDGRGYVELTGYAE